MNTESKRKKHCIQYLPKKDQKYKLMNGQILKLLVFLTVATFLAGCQSHLSNQPRFRAFQDYIDNNELASMTHVDNFAFQGWEPLDNRHVTILSNQKRSFLVSLINFCNDLSFTANLTLKQAISNRLNSQFDAVIVNGQHCRIKSIHQIDQKQRNELQSIAKRIR